MIFLSKIGLDPDNLEKYLSDEEFEKHFDMTKEEFEKRPIDEQTVCKRELHLL